MMKKHAEFDPVKQGKDNTANAIVWSTASLNAAVEARRKGLPLKANPFLDNDIQLLKPNLVFRRTPEEIEDWLRCKEDKVYFGSKCYLKTPTGVQNVTLRDYQEEYLRACKEHNWTIWLAARQSGKSVTTGVDMLHELLFDVDRAALIVSKSRQAGIDLLKKIKDMYRFLPWHIKAGINIWNVHEISFDNNSSVKTVAPSTEAGVGDTVNFLLLDEFAWMPMTDDECQLYLDNILPTISQDETSKVRIMSTQNGRNIFYRLWQGAVTGENEYYPFKVDWQQVPQYNKKTQTWERRTEQWKERMVKKMGSEESFYYMYGTQFMSSDRCLVAREKLTQMHSTEQLFRKLLQEEEETLILPEQQKQFFRLRNDISLHDISNRDCIVLVDLAEGGGGDSTVFHIFEVIQDTAGLSFDEIAYWKSSTTDLETASLVFWVMCQTVFTQDRYICSVELNTYGALFETYVLRLNEHEYKPEWNWRFSAGTEFDYASFVRYKKSSDSEPLPGIKQQNSSTVPGIRWNSSNKPAACMLLKNMIEKDIVRLHDTVCIAELEAFEDKNGKGHYSAAYGHDDLIMTCVQLPKLVETVKFKCFAEEMSVHGTTENSNDSSRPIYDDIGNGYSFFELPQPMVM